MNAWALDVVAEAVSYRWRNSNTDTELAHRVLEALVAAGVEICWWNPDDHTDCKTCEGSVKEWSCSHCGPCQTSTRGWCDMGCGSDYNAMALVACSGRGRKHVWGAE